MDRKRRWHAASILVPFFVAVFTIAPGARRAYADSSVPVHARASGSDAGWKCERAFRAVKGGVAIQLPQNARLEYSGDKWKCDPLARRQGNGCIGP